VFGSWLLGLGDGGLENSAGKNGSGKIRSGISGPVTGPRGVGAVFLRGRDLRRGLKTNFA
jgi:hypothetical protein